MAKRLPKPKAMPMPKGWEFETVSPGIIKLTDGEGSLVPARLGMWGGYHVTGARAWVMEVAPGQWVARCRNQAVGPCFIHDAKRAALGLAQGLWNGPVTVVADPVRYLNRLTAVLNEPVPDPEFAKEWRDAEFAAHAASTTLPEPAPGGSDVL